MKIITLLVALTFPMFLLTGCGTTATQEDPERMGFIMVSQGQASGVAKLVGAGVNYCKATQYNMQGVAFTGDIVYEGDSCRVSITAADK